MAKLTLAEQIAPKNYLFSFKELLELIVIYSIRERLFVISISQGCSVMSATYWS